MKKAPRVTPRRQPRTWMITGLLASIAVAYVAFIFVPGQKSISELQAQVQERHQQILQAQSLTRPIAMAKQRLSETREVGLQWRADAPRHTELITHFASLTQQAEAAGVKIERLDPLPAIELHLVAQQNVTLQFSGSFAAVFDLVRRLESLPGTVWIRNLRLSSNASTNVLKGELTLTIFVDRAGYSD